MEDKNTQYMTWDAIFNSMGDAIFVADKNNIIIKANTAFAKLLGLTVADIIGKKCYELVHKSYKPWPDCPFEKSKKDKKPHIEEVNDPAIGIPLLVTISPIINQSGELVGVVHVSKEITHMKKAEAVIQKNKEELNAIIDAAPAMVFYKDRENRFIRVNKTFADIIGMPKEKLEGKSCFDIFSRYEAEKYWQDDKQIMASGRIKHNIIETMDTQNGTRWVQTDKIPYKDEKGNIVGVIGFAIDITEQRTAQAALAESEMKYKTMYDASGDAIMILDPVEGFISANKATLKLFGASSEKQLLSLGPADLSPDYQQDGSPSPQKAHEVIALALKNGSHLFEWVNKKMNGEEFFASVLLTRIVLKGVTVLQATVRDISELKKTEDELKKKIEELERFQRITVGRELKMKELKARIAELERALISNKRTE